MRGPTIGAGNGTVRQPVRVLIVDDQPCFLDAARMVIGATPGFEHAGDASSGEQAIRVARRLRPHLVLLDVSLPGIDGLETSRELTALPAAPLVVLISADDDPALHELARGCGAAAFLSKQRLRPRMLRALWDRHGADAPITQAG